MEPGPWELSADKTPTSSSAISYGGNAHGVASTINSFRDAHRDLDRPLGTVCETAGGSRTLRNTE